MHHIETCGDSKDRLLLPASPFANGIPHGVHINVVAPHSALHLSSIPLLAALLRWADNEQRTHQGADLSLPLMAAVLARLLSGKCQGCPGCCTASRYRKWSGVKLIMQTLAMIGEPKTGQRYADILTGAVVTLDDCRGERRWKTEEVWPGGGPE